jgi:hypothetical protein
MLVITLTSNIVKRVEEKIRANGRLNGNQDIIMHIMSTLTLLLNGYLFFYKVSSISKKRKDELGKMILGNDVLTK